MYVTDSANKWYELPVTIEVHYFKMEIELPQV